MLKGCHQKVMVKINPKLQMTQKKAEHKTEEISLLLFFNNNNHYK